VFPNDLSVIQILYFGIIFPENKICITERSFRNTIFVLRNAFSRIQILYYEIPFRKVVTIFVLGFMYFDVGFCINVMNNTDEFEDWGVEKDVNMLESNNCNALDSECRAYECNNAFNTNTINIMN